LEEARDLFRESLARSPQPESWHNLAKVCENLGDLQNARRAYGERRRMLETGRGGRCRQTVSWVDPETFAKSSNVGPANYETLHPGQPAAGTLTDSSNATKETQEGQGKPGASEKQQNSLLGNLQKLIDRF
jgi:hypothetical protein